MNSVADKKWRESQPMFVLCTKTLSASLAYQGRLAVRPEPGQAQETDDELGWRELRERLGAVGPAP